MGLSAGRRAGASVTLLLLGLVARTSLAVTPTAGLRLSNGVTAYAAPAWFGLQVPEEDDATYLPLRVPEGDADGCSDVSVEDAPEGGFVLLVERGNCFFDVKALAAQEAGAEGLVVMNSVEGIYQVRDFFVVGVGPCPPTRQAGRQAGRAGAALVCCVLMLFVVVWLSVLHV